MVAAGCGDDEAGRSPDAATRVDAAAAGPDAAIETPDAAAAADAGPPVPLTFRLRYAPDPGTSPNEIYVEITCTQQWVAVFDGDARVPIDSDCGICSCDDCVGCGVCDCAVLFEAIAKNQFRDHAWNGVTHPTQTVDGCGVCETEDTLAPGTYTARFCYHAEPTSTRVCDDVTFDYPAPSGVVEHVVTTAP